MNNATRQNSGHVSMCLDMTAKVESCSQTLHCHNSDACDQQINTAQGGTAKHTPVILNAQMQQNAPKKGATTPATHPVHTPVGTPCK
jgi:hypothetical protein